MSSSVWFALSKHNRRKAWNEDLGGLPLVRRDVSQMTFDIWLPYPTQSLMDCFRYHVLDACLCGTWIEFPHKTGVVDSRETQPKMPRILGRSKWGFWIYWLLELQYSIWARFKATAIDLQFRVPVLFRRTLSKCDISKCYIVSKHEP